MPQLVVAAYAAIGIVTTATSTLTFVTLAVAGTLISTGLSMVTRSITSSKQDRGVATPSNSPSRQVVKQATPRQRFVYGRALVGGAVSYMNRNPPYMLVQYLVAAHRCDAIEAVYVNGYRCEFNAVGDATTPRFRRNGVPYLKMSARLGDPDQAIDPLLASEFPDVPTTFRQRGHTVVTLRAYFGTSDDDHREVWGSFGRFQPQFLMRGKPLYDPRSPMQDRDDETTWRWSDNWALNLADWIRAPYGGRKKASQIDWTATATEADLCDQPVGLSGGGSERRYTLNGGLQSDAGPFQVLDGMLSAAGEAAALWRRGEMAPLADVVRQPVRTMTQDDLAGPITYRNARPRGSVLNTVRSEFIHPGRDYKPGQTPTLSDAALVAADGEVLDTMIERGWVLGEERAQRLDKITLRRSRLGRELQFRVGVEHLALEVGDEVRVQLRDFGLMDGIYVIRSTAFSDAMQTIDLVLEEAAPVTVHEWTPATDVQESELVEIIDPEAV